MSKWSKREILDASPSRFYSDIWDGDGWQINKSIETKEKPYLLLDAMMPHDVPASSIVGQFATLFEAQAEADRQGKPDWSDWASSLGAEVSP